MIVEKGWGHEEIFASNDKYCGKLLVFKEDGQSSTHFHLYKHETWRCLSGHFCIKIINTVDASSEDRYFHPGDTLQIEPGTPHRIVCLWAGTILEVSTPDSAEDNYRIAPGDSQR